MKKSIPVCEPKLYGNELELVTDCIKTNWISSKGKYIERFEKEFANFCGVKHGIAVFNGTVAIHLALISAGIKTGDEVIVPAFTTVCSTNPIFYCNAKPVLVDAEPKTWNIDPTKIEKAITNKTKAILPVHLYGHPCDMDAITEIAKKHGLLVIEDAAEAHGAEYRGKRVGSFGDISTFSFYANKIITTGEGGMLLTDDAAIADRARSLRDQAYGKENRFMHESIGFNYRMTNLQAAIGCAQMKHIGESIEARRKNAKLYNSLLQNVGGITLPPEAKWAKNAYWMYTIMLEKSFGTDRDTVMKLLERNGIGTRPVFYPIHNQPAYGGYFRGEKYPVAEELSKKGINLPSANALTKNEIERVVDTLVKIGKK
jgi:perosamine synthetase